MLLTCEDDDETIDDDDVVIDITSAFHSSIADYWEDQVISHKKETRILRDRFANAIANATKKSVCQGDVIIENVRNMFHHGLGIEWGEDQVKVFNTFLFSALPLIYGEEWGENKARVLREWNKDRECPFTVVSMARRNGKTYVTSGAVVAMLLCLPIKIAIFSTCKRTSMMMMSAAVDMLEKAFELGTHVDRQKFVQISKNMESIVFEGPNGGKHILGCFPGSVRVSFLKKTQQTLGKWK